MARFPLALGAALLWSGGGVLVRKGFTSVSPLWNRILNNLLLLFNLASALSSMLDRGHRSAPRIFSRAFLPTSLGIILHLLGAICFNLAFAYCPASQVSSVSSIFPASLARRESPGDRAWASAPPWPASS